ncbi:MAG: DUF1622 domain-containing protein [Erysipelotrichaceae bacterium]|nr:DUF1622 domain-containing protein [Erysipelotrichaceae bacterium]
MKPFVPVMLSEEIGTGVLNNTAGHLHEFVIEIARISMYLLELISVIIIVYTTVVAFYKLIKKKPLARVYLLHGQSVGLSFKLGSEILRTVTARSIEDIWEVFLLIIIKALMVLLIEWELKGIEKPGATQDAISKGKTAVSRILSPIANNHGKSKQEDAAAAAEQK